MFCIKYRQLDYISTTRGCQTNGGVSRRGRPGVHSPIFGIPSVAAGIVYVHSIELVHSFTNAMIGGTASRVPSPREGTVVQNTLGIQKTRPIQLIFPPPSLSGLHLHSRRLANHVWTTEIKKKIKIWRQRHNQCVFSLMCLL